jgi:hypothetical protein
MVALGKSSMAAPGEQLREIRMKHTELVAPGVAHDPEVEAALGVIVVRLVGHGLG